MSGRSGRYWSLSKLKQRGWTNELIRALLPKPRYIPQDGAVIRKWDREDVLAAEGSPRFANRSPGAKTVSPPQARQTCAALQRAWSAAKTDDSAAWVLAGHYHAAIISRMPAASKNVLCMSQATAWLSEFLALEQRCDAGLLPATTWRSRSAPAIRRCCMPPRSRPLPVLPPSRVRRTWKTCCMPLNFQRPCC